MRILVLTADYPPYAWSGIGVAVESQVNALADRGIQVDVLLAQNTAITSQEHNTRVKIHSLTGDYCPVDPDDFDIIHLHSIALSEFALELKKRYHKPLIYTVHSLLKYELSDYAQSELWSLLQIQLMVQCDHLVFVSAQECGWIKNNYPFLRNKTSHIPNGLVVKDSVRNNYTEKQVIVFAGRFVYNKGIDVVLDMIPYLSKESTEIIIAGGHGDDIYHQKAIEICKKYNDTCTLTGWLKHEQIQQLFSLASIVIVPSRYEPFGLVAIEALQAGAIVMASTSGDLPNIVSPESGGVLIDSFDGKVWADKVQEVLDDVSYIDYARQHSADYVNSRYSLDNSVNKLIDCAYARLS